MADSRKNEFSVRIELSGFGCGTEHDVSSSNSIVRPHIRLE